MSLNGLDAPAIQEAYQYAIAESGGWFLLKYANRDSVELYERGRSGVNEARVAVSKYEETSPLYGLIIYRRRKVLIKYVPEGTSRLLQARTAVHFQDVMEKYAPYETLLEIKTSEALSDTALAAVFPLHTASPAISSNRLNEISEDAEDGASPPSGQTSQPPSSLKLNRERRADRAARSERQRLPRKKSKSPPPAIQVNGEASPLAPSFASPKSTISQFLVREESGHRSISSLTSPSIASATEYAGSDRSDTNTEPESAPPSKTELVRPTSPPSTLPLPSPDARSITKPSSQQSPLIDESETAQSVSPVHEYEKPFFVPETRKPTGYQERSSPAQDQSPPAPIPTLRARDETAEQPGTDKPVNDDPYDLKKYDYLFKPKPKLGPRLVSQDNKKVRPAMANVVAVPSNIRPQPPKKDAPMRPKSQGPSTIPASQLPVMPAPPPIPNIPEYSPRPLSRGSVKSLPSHKSTGMTPDKLRLMKAIELRKKQMRKSQGAEMTGLPKFDSDVPDVPKIPEQPTQKAALPQQEQALSAGPESQETPSNKADSGIEMSYHNADKQEDKATLDLLESPKKEVDVAGEKSELVEEPSSPTPTTEQIAAQLTPKAGPASPMTLYQATQHDVHKREVEHMDSETEEPARSPPRLAQVPTLVEPTSVEPEEPSLDESQVFGDDPYQQYAEDGRLEPPAKSPRRQNSDLAKRRRGYIEPLHLEDMSSDDEFVEELRSATLHQAKPMTVAKSPIMASFIRRPSSNSVTSEAADARAESALQRTISSDSRQDEKPEQFLPESEETTPYAERYDPLTGLRRNVSSGITRRIQALADMSGREPSPNGYNAQSQAMSPENSTTTLVPRDRAVQSRGPLRPSRSRTSSLQKTARLSARMSATQQQQQPGSMFQQENGPVMNVHRDPATNRDSVSVTARIVRPPPTNDETPPAEQLQQHSYMFSSNRPVPTETMAQLTRLDTSTPPLTARESAASISPETKRMSSDQPIRTMHSSTRNHFGRHRQPQPAPGTPLSPHPDDFPVPPAAGAPRAPSAVSLASTNDESSTPKESTRTSRFFKRMSNITSKRRSGAPGSIASESTNSASDLASVRAKGAAASRDGERSADMPPAVIVGSLNVQFPDSLLWKRRIVSIDDSGNLCFAISQAMEHQRGTAKKFPLSDFRMPYVPDLDRQELPFSVMLDFVDGGTTLQAACEDAMTHRQVVHVLKSYWKAWQGQ